MSEQEICERYALKRPNFVINQRTDAGFYAPRSRVDIVKIVESLQVNLVTGVPPKRLFWGLYGGGKTHTLFKVANELEKLTPIYVQYVECPNLAKRSTFLHLYHDGIMASIGQEFALDLFMRFVEAIVKEIGIRRDALIRRLLEETGSEELSHAIAALGAGEPERKLLFWRYISGVEVAKDDLPSLGQTQDLTEAEPSRLADVIITMGRLVKKIHHKTLVVILDELDRLKYVGEETGSSFQNALRRLLDDTQVHVSFLNACSASNLDQLPFVFGGKHGPVLSRIGEANIQEIPELEPGDIDGFIKALIGFVRDTGVNLQDRITDAKKSTKELIEPDFFPFTQEGIEALKSTLQGIMTPREVTQRMTQAVGRAFLMGRKAVTRNVIG
jgi:hypothetical protein